jgi:hypothetical protein
MNLLRNERILNKKQMKIEDDADMSALADAKLHKLKKRINANNWSNELEDLMRSWGEKAAGSRELHEGASSYWKRVGDSLYLPVIIFSTVGGVTNFGAASFDNQVYWMYGIGTLNILTAAMAAIAQYYKPDEKSQNHTAIARNFGSFYRNMMVELGMSRGDRMNSEDLIRWAKNEYDRISSEAPAIPPSIINNFKDAHGNSKNNLPDVITCNYEIKINRPESHCITTV